MYEKHIISYDTFVEIYIQRIKYKYLLEALH